MANQVLFNPSPTQETFLEAVFSSQYRYILFGGAIRGGKTYAALGALILLSRLYPGSRWVVVRDSLMNLRLTTIPSFLKMCPTGFIKRYDQSTQTVTFSNGSQILFFGEQFAEDKELLRFRGLECNGFVLEECNEMQEATFYKCVERAGSHIPVKGEKPPPLILCTCNPSKNWVKRLFYDRFIAGTLPTDWAYIPSKITDNPYIMEDTAYLESLKTMPSFEYSQMVEGDWEIQMKTGGEAYQGFDIEKHIGDYQYDSNSMLYFSFDENVTPYLTCLVFQLKAINNDGFEVRMIDEILGIHPKNTVEAVCDMVVRKYPPKKHKSTVELFGDASSRKQDVKLEKGANFYSLVLGCLKDYKISDRVPKSNENVAMRLSWINSVMEKETGNIRFRIDRHCKNAISDFMLTKKGPDGGKAKTMVTDPKTKVRYQAVAHITDATDYFLCSLFSGKYDQYKRGGQKSRFTFGKNPLSHNHY